MKPTILMPALAAAVFGLALSVLPANAKVDATGPLFKVRVHGFVEPSCSLTQSVAGGRFDNVQSAANTARAATLNLPFNMSCNTGFKVSLTSTRTGLRTSAPNVGGMFADAIAYQAQVFMPGDVAGPTCTSDAMSGACQRAVGSDALPGGVLQGEGHIALTILPGTKPLLAGDYTDSLVMTVSPALSGPAPL